MSVNFYPIISFCVLGHIMIFKANFFQWVEAENFQQHPVDTYLQN